MLLRASRATELLTKEAITGALARVGKIGRGVGSFAWKRKKGLGGAALIGGLPAMGAAEAMKRGNTGMNRAWTAARMRGGVPMAPGMSGVGLNRGWGRTR